MRAFLFSIGESTTDVAKWSLERLGLEVVLLHDPGTSFHEKYLEFLEMAKEEQSAVVRWDADIIATRGFLELIKEFRSQGMYWWMTGKGYCHLRHELIDISGNVMNSIAIAVGLKHMREYADELRPETALTRAVEMHMPRRFLATSHFVGIHGYRQHEQDVARIMLQKETRGQLKDWDLELIEKLRDLELIEKFYAVQP